MKLASDPQVAPLVEVFELYMLRDAALADMREPTAIAARAMLGAGMSPEMILTILEGAVQVAATETSVVHNDAQLRESAQQHVRDLSAQIGPWLMSACLDVGEQRA